MDRRSFIRLLGAGLVTPIIEPKVKYILPPIGGWITPELVLPYLTSSSAWYYKSYSAHLSEMHFLKIEKEYREQYVDDRAKTYEAWIAKFNLNQHKQRSR